LLAWFAFFSDGVDLLAQLLGQFFLGKFLNRLIIGAFVLFALAVAIMYYPQSG
jgi:hypothetical protein